MNSSTSHSIWETLSVPIPAEFAHHAHLNQQIETLEKKNNTGMYILLGLGVLLIGVCALYIIENRKRQKEHIMWNTIK